MSKMELTAEMIRRLDRAEARRLKGGAENRRAAAREAAVIRRQLEERREAVAVQAGLDETMALARARGEEVTRARSGPIRAHDRDGLHNLWRLGRISDGQYAAGRMVRAGLEAREPDLRPPEITHRVDGGGHRHEAFVAARAERAFATARMGKALRAVAVECKDEPACLQMLTAVAGRGLSLSAFGAGRAFGRNLAALKRALDVAAAVNRQSPN